MVKFCRPQEWATEDAAQHALNLANWRIKLLQAKLEQVTTPYPPNPQLRLRAPIPKQVTSPYPQNKLDQVASQGVLFETAVVLACVRGLLGIHPIHPMQ